MLWFRRSSLTSGFAVFAPMNGGAGVLHLQGDSEKPHVAGFAWHAHTSVDAFSLRHLVQQTGAGGLPFIALLGTDHYQTVIVETPSIPEEELLSAIRWKVKDLINFHIDDVVMDYLPIPGGPAHASSLYVVAAQSTAVRELAKPFHDAGLHLDVIDVRETAQHNLAMKVAPEGYAIGLLHLEGDTGLLTFSYGHDLILSRRIEGRGASGDFLLEKVAMEVQRSVDYFERQYARFPLAKLYLAPMPEVRALRAKLLEFLSVGVDMLDVETLFDLTATPQLQDPQNQNTAFHLLGAALREAA